MARLSSHGEPIGINPGPFLKTMMKEAVSQSLYSYWNTLRGARPAPKRFEIDPSRIASNLPDTFILEQVDRGTLRFRLAGTRIIEALGIELRGKNLYDLFDADDAATLDRQIELITRHCAVGVFHMSADDGEGQTTTFEILLLPLTHTRDCVERFLGSIRPIGKREAPVNSPLINRRLIDHELIWPEGTSPVDKARMLEPQVPLLPTRRDARIVRSARTYLRVYDGGLSLGRDEP